MLRKVAVIALPGLLTAWAQVLPGGEHILAFWEWLVRVSNSILS